MVKKRKNKKLRKISVSKGLKKEKSHSSESGKKSEKRRGENKFVVRILILVAILLIILFILVLSNFGIFEPEEKVRKFTIRDECSIVMGSLMHPLATEGDCKIRCINNCGVWSLEFKRIEFAELNDSCNVCDCYCL